MRIQKNLSSLAIAGMVLTVKLESTQAQSIDYPATGGSYSYPSYYGASQLAFTFQASGASSTISSIDVLYAGGRGTSGSVTVSLYDAVNFLSGSPSPLASDNLTFSASGLRSDMSLTGLINISGVPLTSGQQYTLWFDLDSAGFDIASDSTLTTGAYTTTGGWSVIDSRYLQSVSPSLVWAVGDGAAVAINAGASPSPVPEASGSVAGLGLAMAGLYQHRRRRQNTVTQ